MKVAETRIIVIKTQLRPNSTNVATKTNADAKGQTSSIHKMEITVTATKRLNFGVLNVGSMN